MKQEYNPSKAKSMDHGMAHLNAHADQHTHNLMDLLMDVKIGFISFELSNQMSNLEL